MIDLTFEPCGTEVGLGDGLFNNVFSGDSVVDFSILCYNFIKLINK